MMVRFSPPSEFSSKVNPIGVSPIGQRGGRSLPERLPPASIGSAQAGCFIPAKVTDPRVNSSDIQTRNSASNLSLIAAGSSLERSDVAQTLLDILAVMCCAAFVVVTGCAVFAAFFILFFYSV